MAASKLSKGYRCEFISPVPDYLYCKKCTLVARKLNISSCCGESFCHVCITDSKKEGKPCPSCGEKDYNSFRQVKSQKQISSLEVYCSMKERGCEWSGPLDQLDTHLDPDQDNCQYVDIECPLHCHMAIPKNKVEQHVALHCTKRTCVCQHCNFKATYKEIVDIHLAECKYVPLQCPNLCGVTFERDFQEDHMEMCRLEEVECEFRSVGCEDRFTREDQEEHTRQNSNKHLTLTASLAVETKVQIQQKLVEQNKKHKDKEEKLMKKIEEQEKRIEEQEKKIVQQEKRIVEQEKKIENQIEEQVKKLKKQENKLKKLENKLEEIEKEKNMEYYKNAQHSKQMEECLKEQHKEIQTLQTFVCLGRTVIMTEFNKGRKESAMWDSPAMYTHVRGYKFFLLVNPNGIGGGTGKAVHIQLRSMIGEYDSQLKWPTPKYNITLKLINQHGGRNFTTSREALSWSKPSGDTHVAEFGDLILVWRHVISHSALVSYLNNDTLCINIHIEQV